MKVKAVVALPANCPPTNTACIEEGLREEFPSFDFNFEVDATIEQPEARGFDPNGAYWGSISGDPDESSKAYLERINSHANELYRSAWIIRSRIE